MSVKKCLNCGQESDESVKFCPNCGGAEFKSEAAEAQSQGFQFEGVQLNGESEPSGETQLNGEAQSMSAFQGSGTGYAAAANNEPREHVLAGIVGAFLFSLVGVLLYFILFQINFIAGISGLVMFVLANMGYGIFSKSRQASSVLSVIISIIVTIVMIFVAQYISYAFYLFRAFKEDSTIQASFFDVLSLMPEFLKIPDVFREFAGNLAMGYLFGGIATISSIVNMVRSRKRG